MALWSTRSIRIVRDGADAVRAMGRVTLPWPLPRIVVQLSGIPAAELHRAQTRISRLREAGKSLTVALVLAGMTFLIGLADMLWYYNRSMRHMGWLLLVMLGAAVAGKIVTMLWARLRLMWELGRVGRLARKEARRAALPPTSTGEGQPGIAAADFIEPPARPSASARQEQLNTLFDRQAAGYDRQWANMAPIREGLHFLLPSVFAALPEDARILCVGAGTGAEMSYLAAKFPRWQFTAVEPSAAMLNECRQRAAAEGFAERCHFHQGYVDSLPVGDAHDGATCFLVSQFMLEQDDRIGFFRAIGERLRPGGILASSDLSGDVHATGFEALLRCWLGVMESGGVTPDGLARMREAYATDVSILPPGQVATLLKFAGFANPVQFYQSGLIHAWFSTRPEPHSR